MKKIKREKIIVTLTPRDVESLTEMVKQGKRGVRLVTRARILLYSHEGKTNAYIVEALRCAPRMICNVRRRYAECDSVMDAVRDAPRPGQPKKITPKHEAFVIATACTDAPEGHSHWTLDELRKKLLKRYTSLKSVSHERIRHILMASTLKPWREKNVVRSESHAAVSGTDGRYSRALH